MQLQENYNISFAELIHPIDILNLLENNPFEKKYYYSPFQKKIFEKQLSLLTEKQNELDIMDNQNNSIPYRICTNKDCSDCFSCNSKKSAFQKCKNYIVRLLPALFYNKIIVPYEKDIVDDKLRNKKYKNNRTKIDKYGFKIVLDRVPYPV